MPDVNCPICLRSAARCPTCMTLCWIEDLQEHEGEPYHLIRCLHGEVLLPCPKVTWYEELNRRRRPIERVRLRGVSF